MRLCYSIFIFLTVTILMAQEKSAFQAKPEIKIYGNYTTAFGDNMLAKANDPKIGFGFCTSPFSVYNFKIGFGFDHMRFTVNNVSLAGNIDETFVRNIYGFVAYPFEITEKFAVEPKLGLGGNRLQQKTGDKDFGKMSGTSFILGTSLEYEIVYPLEVFLEADYVTTKFKVKTHPENKDFFQKANQLNFCVGLKFNISKNPKKKDDGASRSEN